MPELTNNTAKPVTRLYANPPVNVLRSDAAVPVFRSRRAVSGVNRTHKGTDAAQAASDQTNSPAFAFEKTVSAMRSFSAKHSDR